MTDFLIAVCFGLKDAINPCKLASLAIFLSAGSLICQGAGRTVRFFILFVVSYVTAVFLFRFGVYDGVVLSDLYGYRFLIITFYMITGGLFIFFGAWLLYVWSRVLVGEWKGVFWGVFRIDPFLCGVIGLVLGAMAGSAETFWPRSKGMLMLIQEAFLPGKLLKGVAMTATHEVMSFWPLVLAFLLYYLISRDQKCGAILAAKRTLLYILAAASYVALGASLVWLFFPKTA